MCADVWGYMYDQMSELSSGDGVCWIWGQVFGFRGVGGSWCGVSGCRDMCGTVRFVFARSLGGF